MIKYVGERAAAAANHMYRDPSLLAICLGLSRGLIREENCLDGRGRSDAVALRNNLVVSGFRQITKKGLSIVILCTKYWRQITNLLADFPWTRIISGLNARVSSRPVYCLLPLPF